MSSDPKMLKIAFLTSSNMIEAGPDQRRDSFEHDLEFEIFAKEASKRNMQLIAVVWDKAGINWADFDAVLVGTTWDYVQKHQHFFEVMAKIDQKTRLFNSFETLRANGDKRYLLDLAAKGVPIIPTISLPRVNHQAINDAFDHFAVDQLVVKPTIGAGAWRQALLRRSEPLPSTDDLPTGAIFVQPFLPKILSKGELSLLFYDGKFSHAIRKTPKAGDYRIQSIFGGKDQVTVPSSKELQVGEQALANLNEMPLYARVDLIPDNDENPLLIELELIEPYHYVEQGPCCGGMLMDALCRRF